METPNSNKSIGNILSCLAVALAGLAFTNTPALAAPTVWNVNIGTELTPSDNFIGAAPENTVDSFWNSVTTANPTAMALADSTETASTATLTLTGSIGFTDGGWAAVTGPEIFSQWSKSSDNATPFGMEIGGLSSSNTYDLIIYSDWYWKGNDTLPVTQTVGSGLAGTIILDQISSGTNGAVPGLIEDTDPGPNTNIEGNWLRIKGLTPDGSGTLAFTMGGTNAAFSGFQLVQIDLDDTTPPAPSPMTWSGSPAAAGETSITMTATTASDPSGVEYSFTETGGNPGATNSGWQDSPVYTDTGLNPGITYTYTVTARDKSPNQNPTVASAPASATTLAEDLIAPTPDPMTFGILPAAASITRITMTATTASDPSGVEYYFTETSGNPGGSDSGWQDSPVYTDAGLTPGTTYTYKVKARDKSIAQNETGDSATSSATTDAETTISTVWNVNFGNQVTTNDNYVGAAPENTQNSTWNSVVNPLPKFAMALADAVGVSSAGVTLDLSAVQNGNPLTSIGGAALTSGDKIFYNCVGGGGATSTMTIKGLSMSKTYDVVIYSDWYWKNGDSGYPVTQTLGTGLAGTIYVNRSLSGTNGTVPPLTEDTNPLNDSTAGNTGNWYRIMGLNPDANGQLGFRLGDGANGPFSGFQLVDVTASTLARIRSFEAADATGVINQSAKTIALTVPFGTNLATLAPSFTLSSGTCDQTSGAPPSPTFAASNPVHYVVTDTSTDPDTVNDYAVTVTVAPQVGTLIIDLGNSPGTTIVGGGVIGSGPTHLPLPAFPAGSVLRSITVDATLVATDNENWANELSVLLGPSQGTYTLGLTPSGANVDFAPVEALHWGAGIGEGGVGSSLADTKTDADWPGAIDLNSTALFLGNAYSSGTPGVGGTWSGTITLTYDIVSSGSPYETWAGSELWGGDKNGDGVSNGLAFLLGAPDPDANALDLLPTLTRNGTGLLLTFSCLNAASRGSAALNVEWSNDLGAGDPWAANAAAVPETTGTVNGVSFQVTPNGNLNDVIATIPSTQAAGGNLFGRLSGTGN